jgi:glutathione S-transferase
LKLYDCQPAPNPRRVRIFIAEKGLDIPVQQVDLAAGEQFGEAFRAINPACTVPVLETDSGLHISECMPICAYLEALHPEPALIGGSPDEVAMALMWNHIVENEGIQAIGESFRNFSRAFRDRAVTGPHKVEQLPELVERGRLRAGQFFDRVESRLTEEAWLAGDSYSIADISLLVAVDFAGWIKLDACDGRAQLADWYARASARPSAGA